MYDQIELVKSFCYLGDRLNAGGGSAAAVTASTRIGWKQCRELRELLQRKMLSLKIKGRIYQNCASSARLCGSETRCLRGNEMAIWRTEKALIRAVWGVKLIEKRSGQEVMDL